jgi:hypothetical protein
MDRIGYLLTYFLVFPFSVALIGLVFLLGCLRSALSGKLF